MKNEEFLSKSFRDYYNGETEIKMPKRFTRREFGFMFFGGNIMLRHTSFASKKGFENYAAKRAPAHIFYSSAYYSKPAEKRMEDKGWLGADLIFDLDADHLVLPPNCTYETMLKLVKNETKKLIDDFLTRDFGFEKSEIVFSGGRGYHVHIYDEKVLMLKSKERREIVDYLLGNGIDVDRIMKKNNRYNLPEKGEGGWYGKMRRAIDNYATDLKRMNGKDALKELTRIDKVSKKKAERIYDNLDVIVSGNPKALNLFPGEFIDHLIKNVAIQSSKGEADEPVTSDIKRLIRLPGSLHGKTGLAVKLLSPEEFDDFDPLQDAIVFNDDSTEVEFLKPLSLKIKDCKIDVKEGKTCLPKYAAIFACARGFARVV
jgi:DNA primase, eukaryotic-type, small subunit, putative